MTTIASTAQLILASVLLRRRLGLLEGRRIAVSLGRDLAAVILPVIAGVAILVALGGTTDGGFAISDRVGAIVSMAVIGVVMAAALLRHPVAAPLARAPRLRRPAARAAASGLSRATDATGPPRGILSLVVHRCIRHTRPLRVAPE